MYFSEGHIVEGRYKIIRLIGEGATSNVYLSYDLILEIEVSLKVLKNHNIDEKKIKNFQREAHTISLLNNDNIIKLYDISTDENSNHYIVQEYVEGITLKEYIKQEPIIHVKKVVSIVAQILVALEHAHENKVIHKDIKPQNILYGFEGKIKLTDFGISDVLDDESTRTQTLMGTPQYVAPEVLTKSEITYETDIYSVGILIYELLMGYPPFNGEKPTVIMMKQLNQPIPSVIKERDDVPQSLENMIIKASAKKKENRYKNAYEMLLDLSTCLSIQRRNEVPLILEDDLGDINASDIDMKKVKEEEEKKEAIKNQKKKKKIIIGGLVALLFILTIFVSLFVSMSNHSKEIPNLIGFEEANAIESLRINGFNTDEYEIQKEVNDTVLEGLVIKTEPAAGEVLPKGEKIIVKISQGPEKIKLEDYSKKTEQEATNQLQLLGFKVEILRENSTYEQGTVIKQNPASGTELTYGDIVTLTISDGEELVDVPNFNGLTSSEVQTWADDNGMEYKETKVCSDTIEKDRVISQETSFGKKIKPGSTIKVTISTGKCATETDTSTTTDKNDGTT